MADETTGGTSPFDAIRHEDDAGEYWSARELGPLLGYKSWQFFTAVIGKAREACETSGYTAPDHFMDTHEMVMLGSGAQRKIADVHLSRYACYLVVMNGDPDKPIIAQGQTYFARRTREAELADEAALAGISEEQRRLFLRPQVTDHQKSLFAAAGSAGVVTSRDFVVFQDHGYRGLYNGENARAIAQRKGVKPGTILDWMGSEELAANLFRATQTDAKLRRQAAEGITDKDQANRTHLEMGKAVRQFIADQGGTMPEDLPTPAQSIKQLEKAEQKRLEAERRRRYSIRCPPAMKATETNERDPFGTNGTRFMFTRHDGEPIRGTPVLANYFRPLLRRAGLPAIRLHDLGHTAATLAAEEGAPVRNVSDMLGHSSAAMTLDIYRHAFESSAVVAVADVERTPFGPAGSHTQVEQDAE